MKHSAMGYNFNPFSSRAADAFHHIISATIVATTNLDTCACREALLVHCNSVILSALYRVGGAIMRQLLLLTHSF